MLTIQNESHFLHLISLGSNNSNHILLIRQNYGWQDFTVLTKLPSNIINTLRQRQNGCYLFSNAFSEWKLLWIWLRFHRSLIPRVQSTALVQITASYWIGVSHYNRFRKWLDTYSITTRYLNQLEQLERLCSEIHPTPHPPRPHDYP